MRFLLLAVFTACAAPLFGQGQDFSKVEIKTIKVGPNLYDLRGGCDTCTIAGSGGAVGALVGPEGILLIDAQFAPMNDKVVAALRQLSNAPIRFLINTHIHGDHTGGNEKFGTMGAVIIAREQVRNRLLHPNPGVNGNPGRPAPAAALPILLYDGKMTIHLNDEDVQLIAVPAAHTDGDTLVRFPKDNVIFSGDYFRSVQFPNIDQANGGSLKGMIDGMNLAISLCDADTLIVPGHGANVHRDGLIAHRDMIVGVRDKVAALIKQGKTEDEAVAARPTADWDAKIIAGDEGRDRFVRQIYSELKKQ